ncbi:hypothetical protein C8R44DRAFT_745374 [Mycena epipterygia]|nr:hypothetical protein C8R44DRAFT_745374 [Mycena epipterygia]
MGNRQAGSGAVEACTRGGGIRTDGMRAGRGRMARVHANGLRTGQRGEDSAGMSKRSAVQGTRAPPASKNSRAELACRNAAQMWCWRVWCKETSNCVYSRTDDEIGRVRAQKEGPQAQMLPSSSSYRQQQTRAQMPSCADEGGRMGMGRGSIECGRSWVDCGGGMSRLWGGDMRIRPQRSAGACASMACREMRVGTSLRGSRVRAQTAVRAQIPGGGMQTEAHAAWCPSIAGAAAGVQVKRCLEYDREIVGADGTEMAGGQAGQMEARAEMEGGGRSGVSTYAEGRAAYPKAQLEALLIRGTSEGGVAEQRRAGTIDFHRVWVLEDGTVKTNVGVKAMTSDPAPEADRRPKRA